MTLYKANVRKIIRYRFCYYPARDEKTSGWICRSYEDFKKVMRELPAEVVTVNARIHESQDYFPTMMSKYNIIGAWDWFRIGVFPSIDSRFRELAAAFPDNYRQTKNGIWIRRSDLIS